MKNDKKQYLLTRKTVRNNIKDVVHKLEELEQEFKAQLDLIKSDLLLLNMEMMETDEK